MRASRSGRRTYLSRRIQHIDVHQRRDIEAFLKQALLDAARELRSDSFGCKLPVLRPLHVNNGQQSILSRDIGAGETNVRFHQPCDSRPVDVLLNFRGCALGPCCAL